jgi:hypothetical protein
VCLLVGVLLAEVLLVGVLPLVVLLALVGKMVLVAFELLEEKGKTPPELEMPEEEGELLLFGALPVLWCLWHPFSFAGWTGGHRHFCFWSLPMRWFAEAEKKNL